jgi:putative transposase
MPKPPQAVILSQEQVQHLERLIKTDKTGARTYKRARVLLLSSKTEPKPLSIEEVMLQADVSRATVHNIKRKLKQQGLEAALNDEARSGRPETFNGKRRVEITALACSEAPKGYARWSLRLLAARMVELYPEEPISHTQIGVILKKTKSNRTKNANGALVR